MADRLETIELAADEVSLELERRGIGPDERVIVTILPEHDALSGRRASRVRVIAAGLTEEQIDRMIKLAQQEVEPHF